MSDSPLELDDEAVLVVDDDLSVREALDSLLRSGGFQVRLFESIEALREAWPPPGPACLVLDVNLPGQSGLDFQRALLDAGTVASIVVITAHGDIPMSVRAMKAGAIEFLTKPFRGQDLLDAVQLGLERDRARRIEQLAVEDLRSRFASLSGREREVMQLAATGVMNKQIAAELGLSEITVKVHRGAAMRKMRVGNFAELVLVAEKLRAAESEPG